MSEKMSAQSIMEAHRAKLRSMREQDSKDYCVVRTESDGTRITLRDVGGGNVLNLVKARDIAAQYVKESLLPGESVQVYELTAVKGTKVTSQLVLEEDEEAGSTGEGASE